MNKKRSLLIWIIVTLFFLSIGYAAVNVTINVDGNASASAYGKVFIPLVTTENSSGVSQASLPIYDEPTLDTSLTFTDNSLAFYTYNVTIGNGSSNIVKYTGETFNVDTSISNIIDYEIDGLDVNEVFVPGDEKTFTLTYKYKGDATPNTYALEMIFNFTDYGSFYAETSTSSFNITDSAPLSAMNIRVINRNSSSIYYNITSSNDKFVFADSDGNSLGNLEATAGSDSIVTVYLKKQDGITYYKTDYVTDVVLSYGTNTIDFGNIPIITTATGEVDNTPPQIGAITLNMGSVTSGATSTNETGSLQVSFSRTDTGGAPLGSYYLRLYNSSNVLVASAETTNTSYTFTGIAPETYYVSIYGTDDAPNSGEDSCSAASTSTTNCRLSNTLIAKWIFTVTYSVSNMTYSNVTTVNYNETLSTTLTANTNYKLPTSITVTMGGTTLSSGYTYSSTTGVVTVANVTGDITITGRATYDVCLIKGTKILMGDGTYKNVEDIGYDDLIKTWAFDLGRFVNVYPAWIEKEATSTSYQMTTFSDGETLKTAGFHGVFSKDLNLFVSVDDSLNFHVGTHILKYKDNHFYEVMVTNIEIVNEEVTHYHIVASRYYDIIADNTLTTDGTVILSNLYGFNEDLTWTSKRSTYLEEDNLYNYDDFKNILPKYMFLSLRVEEIKYLVNQNIMSKELIDYYFMLNQANPLMVKSPMKINDYNVWMVTTSDDIVNDDNKNSYLRKEDSEYFLPNPLNADNFLYWYDTTSGKTYQPGDIIKIEYGTYFEAIYSEK